jgi:hypothetical protein
LSGKSMKLLHGKDHMQSKTHHTEFLNLNFFIV